MTFERAARDAGKSDEEFTLDKSAADTLFEIVATHGKTIEGRFAFRLKSKAGTTLVVSDGTFVAEDRQL